MCFLNPVHEADKPVAPFLGPTKLAQKLNYIIREPSTNPNLILPQTHAGAQGHLTRGSALDLRVPLVPKPSGRTRWLRPPDRERSRSAPHACSAGGLRTSPLRPRALA